VANSPERFELSADIDADRVTLVAELRDKDYRPEKDMTVTAMVSSGSREAVAVQLRPADRPGVLEGTFSPGESGVFFVESLARREQETMGTARLSFRYDTPAEYFGTRQNRALLTALGAESGGGYWAADKLDGLVAAIRNSAAGITEINVWPLWDAPALFVLLLLLKSTEWLLRRRWRSI
jgi:hypothetical protein